MYLAEFVNDLAFKILMCKFIDIGLCFGLKCLKIIIRNDGVIKTRFGFKDYRMGMAQ
jgi:hypothetical protein